MVKTENLIDLFFLDKNFEIWNYLLINNQVIKINFFKHEIYLNK